MPAVGEGGIDVGVQGAAGSEGVSLDAWNLDQAAYGVAGHAQMVLQAHLCGIFDLCHRAAEELAGRRRSHGAS